MNSEAPETGLQERLKVAAQLVGGPDALSKLAEIPRSTFANYLSGRNDPKTGALVAIARAAGVSIGWLATGEGPMRPAAPGEPVLLPTVDSEIVMIPRYDARLAAGTGSLNQGSQVIGQMPIPLNFLMHSLGKSTPKDLALLEVRGDSMEPTLSTGDLALVDMSQTAPQDGLAAIVYEDFAQIKRLRFGLAGVDVISDNRDMYPPERLSRQDAERLRILGRVVWAWKRI